MLTFQDLIFKLLKFWGDHGCLLEQGHDVETGAGTFNPSTFLRCLGPEPYNSVYVEPSRRPQDGRYGENPNRLQLFHQLQVVMKPSPKNIQELYLESLRVIGFDLSKHDVRFVHDDWESPTLGAWGLGWEVWIDGMEVTQFTYFQQVAGHSLNPITVEITYGLERLSMFIQNVDNVLDMKWNDSLTYGDLCYKREFEWSTYNFETSNPEMWKRHFEDFEREALSMIELGLTLPAYDFVIKASHAFNMLEARGVISVTERTGYIQRVRNLSLEIATAYLEGRKKDHFPLLKNSPGIEEELIIEPKLPKSFDASKRADFLLEIGCEELPAGYIPGAMLSLEENMKRALNAADLAYEKIEVFGSPRRLSLLVHSLAEGRAPSESERRGPPISVAFDPSGEPTKQGVGFFTSLGLKPMHREKLEGVKSVEGYLFATIKSEGCSTIELLAKSLPSLILDIKFPKKMRWSDLEIAFARPLRWIVALYDHHVVPFHLAGIASSQKSFGHAQLSPKEILLKNPEEYLSKLRKYDVLVDPQERETSILNQLKKIEEAHTLECRDIDRVMKEVVYLSEWPQLAFHSFDKSFLRAPDEVLVSEMVEHQRYFPLYRRDGTLSNNFVITADNTPNPVILRNNLSVLSARLADGTFLYEQDLKNSLEEFNEKLKTITFQKDLGSLYEKVKRLVEISEMVALVLHHKDCEVVKRAALLCKGDLASDLVGEFPELQGIIGKHYALHQKESHEVALAIEEHYLPKVEGGPLPLSSTGLILSLTDKIDNLIGYFSVGLKPSSSSDPYAMRRQSIGLLKILIENELSLNLEDLFLKATSAFAKLKGHTHNQKSVVTEILDYLTARAKVLFLDYEFKKDEIEASIQGLCVDPYDQFLKTKALNNFRYHADFPKLFEVYKRAKGQLENQKTAPFKLDLAHEPQEKKLAEQLSTIASKWQLSHAKRDYETSFSLLATLKQPLADLFDNVKILADDPKVRENRLALLQEVFSHFNYLLDFSKIQD